MFKFFSAWNRFVEAYQAIIPKRTLEYFYSSSMQYTFIYTDDTFILLVQFSPMRECITRPRPL